MDSSFLASDKAPQTELAPTLLYQASFKSDHVKWTARPPGYATSLEVVNGAANMPLLPESQILRLVGKDAGSKSKQQPQLTSFRPPPGFMSSSPADAVEQKPVPDPQVLTSLSIVRRPLCAESVELRKKGMICIPELDTDLLAALYLYALPVCCAAAKGL